MPTLLLLLPLLLGCVGWRTQNVTPQEVLARGPVEAIRVATADSTKGIVVYQPRIVSDTLTGHPTPTAIQRLAIPVRDVTQVSTRYRHIGKTLLAGLAIAGGVAVYGLLQSLNAVQ